MFSEVVNRRAQEAFEQINTALGVLVDLGVDVVDAADAAAWIRSTEKVGRLAAAVQVAVVDEVDRGGWHKVEGHHSAKIMVRHVAGISDLEAGRRWRAAKALRSLPSVKLAFETGRIGRCQVDRITRTHANPRVRAQLVESQRDFATLAENMSYRDLHAYLKGWEDLADEDGTADRAQRSHEKRDAKLIQNFDGSWEHSGGCGSLQGAEEKSIFDRYVKVEWDKDWALARAEHGDAATVEHLRRTEAQRRADARHAIYLAAADVHAAKPGGSVIVTNIVYDHTSFDRMVRRFTGAPTEPLDIDADLKPSGSTVGYRCSTLDGHPIDRTEAIATALTGHIRRVVVGADGVVLDMSRKSRLFTGAGALAVKIASETCYWAGCEVPVTDCETEHLHAWVPHEGDEPGETNPHNGAPLCGYHNRLKQRGGFDTKRDALGEVNIHRPDGTRLW